jgi:hypothetical protein
MEDEKCEVSKHFDTLKEHLFAVANDLLVRFGTFYAFAAVINKDGACEHWQAQDGNEPSSAQEHYSFLARALSAATAKFDFRAVGICVDVRAVPPGYDNKVDTVMMHLEHKLGYAIQALFPYIKNPDGTLTWHNYQIVAAEATLFRE